MREVPSVQIVTDGNPFIGYGHIRRSAALAERLKQEGINVTMLGLSEDAKEMLPSPGIANLAPDLVVFDVFDGIDTLIANAREQGQVTITLDWFGQEIPDFNIVVFAHDTVRASKQSFIGFEYIILREEIIAAKKILNKGLENVLVCLGGGDLLKQSEQAAGVLAKLGLQTTLVLGPMATDIETGSNIRKLTNPPDFPHLLAASDWAVTNAGGCFFEALYLGTPAFALPQSPMESRIAACVAEKNAVLGSGLENIRRFDKAEMENASNNGMELIDGKGLTRVATIVKEQAWQKRNG